MTKKNNIRERLLISTVGDDALDLAKEYGVGLELAQFCTAWNMDENFEESDKSVRACLAAAENFTFHAPFNELATAAIDPLILEVTRRRVQQACDLAEGYGVRRIVMHSTFIPTIYYPEWYVERSAEFWKSFLADKPADLRIYIENVLDETPDVIVQLIEAVADPRLQICLDLGHANAFHSKVPVADWIEAMLPYLGHTHIHNNEGGWDTHQPLGEGTIPMAEMLRMLLEKKPDLTFAIENMHAEPSMRWLCENGFLK